MGVCAYLCVSFVTECVYASGFVWKTNNKEGRAPTVRTDTHRSKSGLNTQSTRLQCTPFGADAFCGGPVCARCCPAYGVAVPVVRRSSSGGTTISLTTVCAIVDCDNFDPHCADEPRGYDCVWCVRECVLVLLCGYCTVIAQAYRNCGPHT